MLSVSLVYESGAVSCVVKVALASTFSALPLAVKWKRKITQCNGPKLKQIYKHRLRIYRNEYIDVPCVNYIVVNR